MGNITVTENEEEKVFIDISKPPSQYYSLLYNCKNSYLYILKMIWKILEAYMIGMFTCSCLCLWMQMNFKSCLSNYRRAHPITFSRGSLNLSHISSLQNQANNSMRKRIQRKIIKTKAKVKTLFHLWSLSKSLIIKNSAFLS